MSPETKTRRRSAAKVLWFCVFGFLALAVFGTVWLYHFLPTVPNRIVSGLKEKNIELSFVSAKQSGFQIILQDVSVRGTGSPVLAQVETLQLAFGVHWGWPVVALGVDLTAAKLAPNAEAKTAATQTQETAAVLPAWAPALKSLLTTTFRARHLTWHERLDQPTLYAVSLDLAIRGLTELEHSLVIDEQPFLALLNGTTWTGKSSFQGNALTGVGHQVNAGPFPISADFKVSLSDLKWSGSLSCKQQALKVGSTPGFKSAEGSILFEAQGQGLGSEPRAFQVDGVLKLPKLLLALESPQVTGKLSSTVDLTFSRKNRWTLKGNAEVDLGEAEVRWQKQFAKPSGVPLFVKASFDGNEEAFLVPQFAGRFKNLTLSGAASLKNPENPFAEIAARIDPTELAGWESFFPEFRSVAATGTVSGRLQYQGPVADWRQANIDLDLTAKAVRLPVVALPNLPKGMTVKGIVQVDTSSQLSYQKGEIRSLNSLANIDASQVEITQNKAFKKAAGTAFNVSVSASSNGKRVQIKQGAVALGRLSATLKGTLENLTKPLPKISFATNSMSLEELASFCPGEIGKHGQKIRGTLTAKGSLIGDRLSSNFRLEARTGESDLALEAQVVGQETYELSLKAKSTKFHALDFIDPPAQSPAAPLGAIAIPTSTNASEPTTDFRKNPWLKKIRARAALSIASFSYPGQPEIRSLRAEIDYRNLQLSVAPLSLQALGGQLESRTHWNGDPTEPQIRQELKVTGVDADAFVSSYSPAAKGTLAGRLSLNAKLSAQGFTADGLRKSSEGKGDFSLSDGGLNSVRFTEEPLTELKKIPLLSSKIRQTQWSEKIADVRGDFSLSKGELLLSNTVLRNPYFSATASQTKISAQNEVTSQLVWTPTKELIDSTALEPLRDASGVFSVPLKLSGALPKPSLSVDTSALADRGKAYAERLLAEKKQGALKKLEAEGKKQIGAAIKKLF